MRIWLKDLREKRNLTQQQVAELSGVSRVTYTRIECGSRRPSPELAQKLALIFDFDWKLFFEDSMTA